jgi:hypothetical protein
MKETLAACEWLPPARTASATEATMRRFSLALLAAVLLAQPAHATTDTTNFTDLWWNPSESGWGVTVTQDRTTLFLTFFVYGPDGRPTWVTAALEYARTGTSGQPVFSGDLVVTTGPYYGSTFNQALVTRRVAGTATFAPASATSARLDYTVDGVPVTKQVVRQTFRNENLTGTYILLGEMKAICAGEAPESLLTLGMVSIAHNGTSFSWREYDPSSPADACTAVGTSVQEGQLTRATGTATCTFVAGSGTLRLSEITSTPIGLIGRYDFTAQQCRLTGPFTALRQVSVSAARAGAGD